MKTPKIDAENILNAARRALAVATTAGQVLDAGKALPDLISALESRIDAIDDEIAAEAESIDRSRTNDLRSEKDRAGDLLTDVEYLMRRIEDRHKAKLRDDSDTAMKAVQAAALEKCAAAYALVLALEEPVRAVLAGAEEYQRLLKEIGALRNQLAGAKRDDLRIPPMWRGIAEAGDDFGDIFDFLTLADPKYSPPGIAFLKAISRLKDAPAGAAFVAIAV